MKLSNLSIKRPVTTIMIVLLVVLLGIISFNRTSIDLFPNLVYPGAAVITEYSGVGPEEVETMVTKPLESSLATVTNIQTLSSTSSKGQSVVVAEFNWGTDMDTASMDMRESIDMIEGALPDDISDPFIVQFDPSMLPIMQMGVSGNKDLASLKKVIEDRISPRLERLEGVAAVNLTGGKKREILVSLDQSKLNNYSVTFSNIRNTLMMENLNISGGSVERGNSEYLVRVTGKYDSLKEIEETQIPTLGGGTVPLEELGDVTDTFEEMKTKAKLNGKPSIGLTVQKSTDANTVAVSNRVKEEINKIEKELNGNIKMVPIMDQADYIEQSIGSVGRNAIYGAILAVLVLWLFLRNLRSTVIIATAIPVSIITTFMLIYFGDLTINMMTLGGLALGIGMLVDNSIVVLENIYRYRRDGADKVEAARKGSNEVGMAIAASTITTAIVFLPVVFVEGMASQLFEELALTVSFSLLASLLVSLTLIPVMSSKILKIRENNKKNKWMEKLRSVYRSSLEWSLSHRKIVIMILIVAIAGSLSLYPIIGSEFIPSMDQGQFTVTAKLPVGTSLERTETVSSQIEKEVLSIPEVDTVLTNVGSTGQMMTGNSSSSEVPSLFVNLKDLSKRDRSTSQVMEEIRDKIDVPDVKLNVESQDMIGGGMGGGKPVVITIKGDQLDILEDIAVSVKNEIKNVKGIREVGDSISEGRPELQVKVNRILASKHGLRVSQIGSALETAINGKTATRYEVGGEEYDVKVKLRDKDINTPEKVKKLLIPSPTGAKVRLNSIADFKVEKGPKSITRENQERYVTVNAALYQTDLGTAMENIKAQINDNVTVPTGYEIEYGGQFQEMQESFKDLGFAFGLAIILVYMVMASQFESLVDPFVIMFTVPMAIIGVLPGLFITGHNISIVSIIGLVMLSGIVVNNAIVLVDYINTLRSRGNGLKEAILKAGPIRLRPILMTALTTILALLPIGLGFGEGAEVQAPMAIVVIGGLTVATVLTLYVVPVLYTIFERFSRKVKGQE